MAGLKPVALEIESVAIIRAIFLNEKEIASPKMVVDLGATRSSLIIVDQGTIQLTISLPLSGEGLTKKISSELKINFDEAEKLKKEYSSKDKGSKLEKTIFNFFENLSNYLQTYLKFYKEETKRKIEKIILSGGGANLYEINNFLEKKTNIKTERGDPLVKITKKPPLSKEENIIYTTAIGLALRGLEEKIC